MDANIVQDFVYPEDGVHIDGQKYPILCRKLSDMRSSEQRLELTPAQSLQCLYEAVEYLSLEVEALDLHATGQRVGELRNQKHVRRSSEEEPPRRPLTIHHGLEGREDPWGALDFVENRPLWQVADEAHGIGCSRSQRHLVVEAQVGVTLPPAHHLGQGRLPALAGSMDQDHWRVRQCLNQALFRETGVERELCHAANCKVSSRLIARMLFVQMQA